MYALLDSMTKTEEQVRQEFIAICTRESKAVIARNLSVSRAYVGDIVYGRRGVSEKIANFLVYRIEVNTEKRYIKNEK